MCSEACLQLLCYFLLDFSQCFWYHKEIHVYFYKLITTATLPHGTERGCARPSVPGRELTLRPAARAHSAGKRELPQIYSRLLWSRGLHPSWVNVLTVTFGFHL